MRKCNWVVSGILLLVACSCVCEAKRSFSIGRSRKKTGNINVRRKGGVPETPRPAQTPDVPVGGHPAGPPPAYPGMGHHAVAPNGAPPPYSMNAAQPPSYSSAVGANANYPRQTYHQDSHIGKIPPRGSYSPQQPHMTTFQGLGPNPYGSPPHTAGLYNSNAGAYGAMGAGGYGAGYGYGQRSSSPFSFGNILTGLAVWNVARGFNSYNRPQHIYIDNREKTNEGPENIASPSNPSIDNVSTMLPQLFPAITSGTSDEVTDDVQYVTEIPSIDTAHYMYTTIHPSLLIYSSENKEYYH